MMLKIIEWIRRSVAVLPAPVKNAVKKHKGLHDLYRRLLSFGQWSSRYHQDQFGTLMPSSIYDENLKNIQRTLQNISAPKQAAFSLIVLCETYEVEDFHLTFNSISRSKEKFSSLYFIVSDRDKHKYSTLIEEYNQVVDVNMVVASKSELDSYPFNTSAFVLYLGNEIDANLARCLTKNINTDSRYAYVDVDFKDSKGTRGAPSFYPKWNPDLQLSTGAITTGVWFKNPSELLHWSDFKLDSGLIMSWFMVLALRGERSGIQHIAFILLSKMLKQNVNLSVLHGSVFSILRTCADWHFVKMNRILALKWKRNTDPLVSIIIPTKNARELVQTCIESVLQKTQYRKFEILLVDNNSDDQQCIDYFHSLSMAGTVRLLQYSKPFNFSAINNYAVDKAKGEYVVLMNNDIEVISGDWLDYMLGHVMRDNIGCVGAKLLFPNNTVQHAGVVMGYGGGAGHAHKFFLESDEGYMCRAMASSNFSAVTAACLILSKSDYSAVGGLDEDNFSVAFNDVDLCLKLVETGKQNVFCAEALLYHHESVSRGFDEHGEAAKRFAREVHALKSKWRDFIANDPAYNPNLTIEAENFAVIAKGRNSNF